MNATSKTFKQSLTTKQANQSAASTLNNHQLSQVGSSVLLLSRLYQGP